jgi:hypothetical protein
MQTRGRHVAPPVVRASGVNAPSKKARRGNDNEDDEGDGAAAEALQDDALPEYDIKGADGEYPVLPVGHQPDYPSEAGVESHQCYWGGARHIKGSEEWTRLSIPPCERRWKCSMSANFRVVKNSAPNTTRHLHHAGPHMSMVFDITQQNSPETGDKTIKSLCFLVQQVNASPDLRGCIVGTHYTSLDINHAKGKSVRGLFYHGQKQTSGNNPNPSLLCF